MNVVPCRTLAAARTPEPEAADATAFADTLDGLDAGLYLVDADGRLIHANAAGRAVLDACNVLLDIRGLLMACDPLVTHRLQQAFAASGGGDPVAGTGGTAIPMVSLDGQRYVAHLLLLTSGPRQRAGATYRAAAALFVRKVALAIPPRSDALRDAFQLTPTELRVLLAIVELGGIPEVAAALGVAATTVRTHVRRLFEKTGTARQADFVKLVAGYATPLRDIGEES